ncbi:hypothetical protein D3C87_1268990 [compost metagenome]
MGSVVKGGTETVFSDDEGLTGGGQHRHTGVRKLNEHAFSPEKAGEFPTIKLTPRVSVSGAPSTDRRPVLDCCLF